MPKHTDEEITRAAERFEKWAETLDPADFEDIRDLAAVAAAADAATASDTALRKAVQAARARGRSWNRIAIALGTSRQAAHQRFAEKPEAARR
jgi:hypothetical protein